MVMIQIGPLYVCDSNTILWTPSDYDRLHSEYLIRYGSKGLWGSGSTPLSSTLGFKANIIYFSGRYFSVSSLALLKKMFPLMFCKFPFVA